MLTRLRRNPGFRGLERAFRLYHRERGRVALGALAAVLAALCLLALPIFAGRALDAASTPSTQPRGPTFYVGWFAALAVAEAVIRGFARRSLIGRSRILEAELKSGIGERIGRAPIADLRRFRPGDLLVRSGDDVEQLRFATGPLLLHGIQSLVVVPGAAISLAALDRGLTLSLAVVAIALAIALRRIAPELAERARSVQQGLADLGSSAESALGEPLAWRALGRAPAATEDIERAAAALSQTKVRLAFTTARLDATLHLCLQGGMALLLWFSGVAILEQGTAPGQLLQGFVTLGIVWQPLLAAGFLANVLPRALAAGRRVEQLFELPSESPDDLSGPRLSPAVVTVRPAPSEDAIEIVSGSFVGVTGPIGGGKSSLLRSMAGLAGGEDEVRVEIAGGAELDSSERRGLFCLVDADPTLFEGTVADNLRLVAPSEATHEELEQALALASLRSPDSPTGLALEHPVREGGQNLSGGQRQRLALARALLDQRPILVLDDALSALDGETADRVIDKVASGDRTLILAAHRLASLRNCESICWIEAGRVSARGTHEELRRTFAPYRLAFERQCEGRSLGAEP